MPTKTSRSIRFAGVIQKKGNELDQRTGELPPEIGCGEESHHASARCKDGKEKSHVDHTSEPDDLDQMVVRRKIFYRRV